MVFGNAAASAPRDLGKKKRANRSAKLKQCKLDARREQWLSQGAVAKNKEGKEEAATVLPRPPANDCQKGRDVHPLEMTRKGKRGKDGIGEEEEERDNCSYSDSSFSSPTGSSILGGTDCGTNYGGSSSSSSSSSGSSVSGCCSGSITEEEEGGGVEDDCLDDWEAIADALAADDDNQKQGNQDSHYGSEVEHGQNVENLSSGHESMKQECGRALPPKVAPRNSRAWRPDDMFRPQSLPTLSKQRSFTIGDQNYARVGANPWSRCASNVPSSCPICCEEFDCTDTSFLPCLCGFRLCLFCHNRILQEDGRCPGCRKHYERQVEAQANGHGGGLALRFDRSSSMN